METIWQTQRRSVACGLLSGVLLTTAVILSRRISGDASAFSSELAACLTGVAASLVAILAASTPGLISDRWSHSQRALLTSGCGIPGVMLGLAVMPPGSSIGLACLLGLYLTATIAMSALSFDDVSVLRVDTDSFSDARSELPADSAAIVSDSDYSIESGSDSPDRVSAGNPQPSFIERTLNEDLTINMEDAVANIDQAESALNEEAALPFEFNDPIPHPASNPQTTQWMSRSTVDGADIAEGAFQVRFAAGQRLAPVHLPFSPPLAGTPEFECEPADDSELRFRTTAVHAYGIRIEVSRPADCDQDATVEVAWMASAAISESVAA